LIAVIVVYFIIEAFDTHGVVDVDGVVMTGRELVVDCG
jgi:hypothetical protein